MLYTEIIADGLKIDIESATQIQNFINTYFDDFRWSSATKAKIVSTAKSAQKWMQDPRFADVVKAGA